ncbi:D-glycero-beta-D-manno-heptose 1-phosphate adenylyltransferase [Ferruginibacter yonginensis]|uniref:D-glycero-beta-D-manno-heptose 1-phosphate adenylyltransferase n=1 Tax=Ferruginibacter yonginensis TaxID=1310416 RepID=A0ABV8QQL2_9BACT
MKSIQHIPEKIYNNAELIKKMAGWQLLGKKIVLTNGVFDIVHVGHIASLQEAASFGDILIVAINSDASVKRLKGPTRPVNTEQDRATLLANLMIVDAVIIFEEDTPLELITQLLPNVLVKGGDYTIEQIAGAKEVIANGGEVKIAGMVPGISTTNIINKVQL